jgi:hypothetical protein
MAEDSQFIVEHCAFIADRRAFIVEQWLLMCDDLVFVAALGVCYLYGDSERTRAVVMDLRSLVRS